MFSTFERIRNDQQTTAKTEGIPALFVDSATDSEYPDACPIIQNENS